MLDPKFVRDRGDLIKEMLRDRAVDFDLDGLVGANRDRVAWMDKADELRRRKNGIGQEIAARKKAGQDAGDALAKMDSVRGELATLESELQGIEQRYLDLALSVPNMVDESVPRGPDETANKEIRAWGAAPEFGFGPANHIDIAEGLGLVDLERAAKVAGARFYYLKDGLVRLNQALLGYALDFVARNGYTLVQPPYMINGSSMRGAVIADDFEDVIYKIDGEDLYMIGTSEHALASMHSGEIIEGGLPLRYAGYSPCFRKEAGAHGRDQKGIFRVHQFEKVEQFVFSRPDESRSEHERMIGLAEEFYQSLGIPHRVVLLSSGDMGKVAAKTYDIEAWMAGQRAYREVVSCSNCHEYQARRLKIRFRDSTDAETEFLHTLNGTLVATSRTMVSIMENFQTKDGHVRVPEPLIHYMGGAKEI